MSKENAKKFLEILSKDPEIMKEGAKYDKGNEGIGVIFSNLAKDKGYECDAQEMEEVMQEAASELGGDDLKNVAGGDGWSDWFNKAVDWCKNNKDEIRNSAVATFESLKNAKDLKSWDAWKNAGQSAYDNFKK